MSRAGKKQRRRMVAITPIKLPCSSVIRRELWLYDSFEGSPEKTIEDLSPVGEQFVAGELYLTIVVDDYANEALPGAARAVDQ